MEYPEIDEDIAAFAAAQVIRMIEAGAVSGADGHSPDAVMEGIIMGLALVIEQAPQCQTPRGLRQTGEAYGKLLLQHAKRMRASFETTGVHPIMDILKANAEPNRTPSKLN